MTAPQTQETLGNRQSAISVLSEWADRLEARAARIRALRDAIIKAQALRDADAPPDSDSALVPIGDGSPAEEELWLLIRDARMFNRG